MGCGIVPADGEPAWLLAWRHRQSQPQAAPAPKAPAPSSAPLKQERHRPGPLVPLRLRGQLALIGIIEPDPWPFDGCVRREPVMDALCSDRVVRKVGWHRCLKCRKPFWSEDIIRLRLCSGAQGCRGDEDRFR